MNRNTLFLLIAVSAVLFLVLAGISIAERSPVGFTFSMIASFTVVGFGFMLKKKWREQEH